MLACSAFQSFGASPDLKDLALNKKARLAIRD